MNFVKHLYLLLIPVMWAHAQYIIQVPADYSKIQDAINASENGDTILVAKGTYNENINFRGKNIFLSSHFYLNQDSMFIDSTIIDGSNPTHPDTGSVVIFRSGETRDAVLQGFTITGGTGTRNYNSAENLYFRTGGGILIDHASPTIMNNYITYNECVDKSNSSGAGGGGIRAGQSMAVFSYNKVTHNTGGYAGGIMLAYCSGLDFHNNLVAYNKALGDFDGGGGIYLDWENVPIVNCTIVNNHSDDNGGGLILTGAKNVEIVNCIIYGNTSNSTGKQIFYRYNGTSSISYCNVEGGFSGQNILNTEPQFIDTVFFSLSDESPCIDAGNPYPNYFDIKDPDNLGFALSPAKGTVTNDLGWQGGNQHMNFPEESVILETQIGALFRQPGDTMVITCQISSPEEQDVEVTAYIQKEIPDAIHSIALNDDGLELDETANDGIYSSFWIVEAQESSYNLDIYTYLTEDDFFVVKEKAAVFTTQGPLVLSSYDYTTEDTTANPGDRIYLDINLANSGLIDTVKNVEVDFKKIDDQFIYIYTVRPYIKSFNNIPPGGISTVNIPLRIDQSAPTGTVQSLKMEIMSNGNIFWSDTLKIEVKESVVGIKELSSKPDKFKLFTNYPNPFNPTTMINYHIAMTGEVKLIIYDSTGRGIKTLVNKTQPAGRYSVTFDASNLASGIYYYKLLTGDFVQTRKMVLLK